MSRPLTPAERQAAKRARDRLGIPADWMRCQACDRPVTGRHGMLCCRCWERVTPEGKESRAARARRQRERDRLRRNVAAEAEGVADVTPCATIESSEGRPSGSTTNQRLF